jgi:hypothetical protein
MLSLGRKSEFTPVIDMVNIMKYLCDFRSPHFFKTCKISAIALIKMVKRLHFSHSFSSLPSCLVFIRAFRPFMLGQVYHTRSWVSCKAR